MSAAVGLSRFTGLLREMAFARLFGASQVFDAFRVGFLLPNMARDLFAEGTLSSAFVPRFTEYLTRDKQEAQRLANLVATAVVIFIGTLCILGILFAPQLVNWFAPGFEAVPGKFDLAVRMTRIMFPFLLLVAVAAQVMGVLNSCNRFGVPALASALFNVGSLLFGLALGYWAGPLIGISPIEGMAWGVVFGGFCQLGAQIPTLRREGFHLRPAIDWSHPGLRSILRMMGPAILGGAAVQINVLVNMNFASFLRDPVSGPNGPVSWLAYAFRFMQLPIGLFGVAVANATLPAISRSLASEQHDDFRRTISRSLALVFLLTLPSAAALAILGRPIVGLIFEGGEFTAYDTEQTARALSSYGVGLIAYSAIKVITPAFYALRDARTPVLISFATIAVNFAAASLLIGYTDLGHVGLALTVSTVATFSSLVQFWQLRKKIGGIYGRNLAASAARIAVAAAGMGIVLAWINSGIESWLGLSRWASATSLAVCIPAGLALYYALCKLLRVRELDLAAEALEGPFRRIAGWPRDRII